MYLYTMVFYDRVSWSRGRLSPLVLALKPSIVVPFMVICSHNHLRAQAAFYPFHLLSVCMVGTMVCLHIGR